MGGLEEEEKSDKILPPLKMDLTKVDYSLCIFPLASSLRGHTKMQVGLRTIIQNMKINPFAGFVVL